MRQLFLVALCVAVFGLAASAQTKLETKWNCAKPTENHSLDVGDALGHNYVIAQGTCTATSSITGEKTGSYTEFQELRKASFTNHGRFNVTMDNGDMVYYTYEGSGPADVKKPAANKWKIVSGNGKHKGISGSGTCSGDRHDDGSSDWSCTGTTSMGK